MFGVTPCFILLHLLHLRCLLLRDMTNYSPRSSVMAQFCECFLCLFLEVNESLVTSRRHEWYFERAAHYAQTKFVCKMLNVLH